jgi:hypothetical protein
VIGGTDRNNFSMFLATLSIVFVRMGKRRREEGVRRAFLESPHHELSFSSVAVARGGGWRKVDQTL